MSVYDLPLESLKTYLPPREEPSDFDEFWAECLEESRSFPLDLKIQKLDDGLKTVVCYDVTYAGFRGQPIKAWLLAPAGAHKPLPCVVEFVGYGGGRGYPISWLTWPSLGYAHLVMDTRGQGSSWQRGDTPDDAIHPVNPHIPGYMTAGILDPREYYYLRLFMDGVRAVEMARSHHLVDPQKIAVTGSSQGGGVSIAVAGLDPTIPVVMPNVPFLCHFRRAMDLVDTQPYQEIVQYCHIHRDKVDQVFQTLSYFDGMNFASRCRAAALFSVGLMDDICPPSTIFAAFNHYKGPKDIRVYPYNRHEGGGIDQELEKIKFIQSMWKVE